MSITGESQAQLIAVINRLMTAQSMMYAFPNELRLGEFICQALKDFPDIDECCLCLRSVNQLIGDRNQAAQKILEELNSLPESKAHFEVEPPKNNRVGFRLHTFERTYGYLLLSLTSTTMAKDQKSLINNFINVLSLELERRHQKMVLDQHQEHLEELVKERTVDLHNEIAERKQMELSLRESEEKFKVMAETSPLAIYMSADIEQKGEYINPKFIELFGYTLEEVPSVSEWWPLAYPDKKYRDEVTDRWQRRVRKAIETKSEIESMETNVTCKDGSVRTISWGYTAIGSQSWAFGLDLTKSKEAMANLKTSEERYRALFDSGPNPMIIHDGEKILDVNPATIRTLGIKSKRDIVGKEPASFVHQGDREESRRRIEDLLVHHKSIESTEFRIVTRNYGERLVKSYPVVIVYENQPAIMVSYLDITEIRGVEEALRESEARLRILYDNSPDMYVSVSPVDAHIIRCNQRLLTVTGYTENEVVGKPVFMMYHDDCMDEVHRTFTEFVKKGTVSDRELIIKRKDGSKLAVSLNVNSVRDKEGNILYSISSWRDITERKEAESKHMELESKLRQAKKLEAVGRMAGGIAHDFNNILQGLSLHLDIINDQLPEDDQLQSNFKHVIKASIRAKDLVKQILTFSQKGEIDFKPIKLQFLIKEAMKLIYASTPTTIEIKEQINTDCSPVLCNANQFHQVLVNLCNNAVQAMEEKGGTLLITYQPSHAKIELSTGAIMSDESEVVELVISDTGQGMDKTTLEHVYDPFFTTKEVGKGTGLGLSLVHGIVADMRGEIRVESMLGEGTTFRILLPVSIEA